MSSDIPNNKLLPKILDNGYSIKNEQLPNIDRMERSIAFIDPFGFNKGAYIFAQLTGR